MADKKISQLTSLAPALSTDELPINRLGTSGKLTVADVVAGEAATRASKDGDLTTLTTTANSDLVSAINEVNSGLSTKIPTSYLDTDTTLAANSDSKIATQKATKAYVLANVTPSATETVQGKAEIATQAETNTGTDDSRFITPLKLKTNLATYGYLTGSGTSRSLPLYSSGTVLGDSAIKQSATGTRILVNGITDDTATALQVSGSIRQTAVTTKLAAFDANGKLVDGGSGSSGTLPLWGTNQLTDSLFRQSSGSTSIGVSPDSNSKFYVPNTSLTTSIRSTNNSTVPETTYSLVGNTGGAKAGANMGVYGVANGSTVTNIGVEGRADGSASPVNIGGKFSAAQGTNNYAVQLSDASNGTGKFLRCMDTLGSANWANITTADITSGLSGTAGMIPKWATSNTLSDSLIYDNGTNLSIGIAPVTGRKLNISNSNCNTGLYNSNSTIGATTYGIYNLVNASNTSSDENIGIYSWALNSAASNTAGVFRVAAGTNNYAIKLIDGNQSTGKVLQCADNNGNAKWTNHYIVNTILANQAFTNEAISIDFNLGNYVIIDYSSSITVATSSNAVSFSNMKEGRIYKIKVIQGTVLAGQTYTPTFAGMKWPAGNAFTPTVGTGKIDFIEVWYDGTNYFGDFIKNYV